MNTRILLTIVLISFSAVAAMLPNANNSSTELSAVEMVDELQSETYKVTPDRFTEILIEKDPSYMLIDLRNPSEFEKYSLPGAINIPFDSLFDDDWIAYVDQDLRKNIFYSNGSTLASAALMLTRQKGFKNNYALEGGLNAWFDNLLNPVPPSDLDDEAAFQLYQQRLAAKQYFTGGNVQPAADAKNNDLLPVPVRKKKKVQGGCS